MSRSQAPLRIALNGYGRIGRNVLRALHERGIHDIEIVAINELGSAEAVAHLTRFDSTHGPFAGTVELSGDVLIVNGKRSQLSSIADPAQCPWREHNIDVVLECTGQFRARNDAAKHLAAGAAQVIIGAVGFDEPDATAVWGVNHQHMTPAIPVISAASCTTHALACVLKVLDDALGVERVLLTEIHAYTSDQVLLDHVHRDLRRGRAGATNIVPTTSSSIHAVQQVLPQLQGKVIGYSVRVPTQNVALVDLSVQLTRHADTASINAVFRAAAQHDWRNIIGYNDMPLVSCDFNHRAESAIFDATETQILGDLAKLVVWYDNEWGYANRLVDLCRWLAQQKG